MDEQRIFEVVYIRSSLSAVWDALTNPDMTQQYWNNTRIESDWQIASKISYVRDGEIVDEHTVLAVDKYKRLSHTFQPLFGEFGAEPPSRVTFLLCESSGVVRFTVIHEDFPPQSKIYRACSEGWPLILSGLKTLLETGKPLPPFTFEPQAARFESSNEYAAA